MNIMLKNFSFSAFNHCSLSFKATFMFLNFEHMAYVHQSISLKKYNECICISQLILRINDDDNHS